MRKNRKEFHTIEVTDLVSKKTKNSDNFNVTFTCDIQSFTDTVYRHAISSKLFEVYVKVAVAHVEANQLQQLPNHGPQKR